MTAEQVWGSTMSEEYTYIPLSEPESVRGRTGIKCGGDTSIMRQYSCYVICQNSCHILQKKKKRGQTRNRRVQLHFEKQRKKVHVSNHIWEKGRG